MYYLIYSSLPYKVLFFFPFYNQEHYSLGKSINLSKIILLVHGKAKIPTKVCVLSILLFISTGITLFYQDNDYRI